MQCNQRPERFGSFPRTTALARDGFNLAEKGGTVPFDGGAGIVLGEAEIEIALAVSAGKSARPRRKAMDEPGKLAEMPRAKDRKLGFVRGPGWHASMIKEGTYLGDLVLIGRR